MKMKYHGLKQLEDTGDISEVPKSNFNYFKLLLEKSSCSSLEEGRNVSVSSAYLLPCCQDTGILMP